MDAIRRFRSTVSWAALAAPVVFAVAVAAYAQQPPWDERTIVTHVDFVATARDGDAAISALIKRGRELFIAKFTDADGRGRPNATQAIVPTLRKRGETPAFQRTGGPDSSACASCHSEPFAGGAGDFVTNVFVSEGFESADFDSLDPSFSSERNTKPLFGDGLLELLAREMTADLHALRADAVRRAYATRSIAEVKLETKGILFGWLTIKPDGMADFTRLEGIDNDLVVRPFSQKGVFTSLRQFTVNAMNAHFGMMATERFGVRWTGSRTFGGSSVPDAVSAGDISALVAFQATLPPPIRVRYPRQDWQTVADAGERAFETMGCATCHRPTLPLKSMRFADPGPYDAAGTLRATEVAAPIIIDFEKQSWASRLKRNDKGEWLVPVYGDLKRHVIVDDSAPQLGNELMAQRFVERDVFRTAPLWGVGSYGSHGHRGDFTTLDGIIRAHGGEARVARDAYRNADEPARQSIIAFLKSLAIQEK
jgi:Di-haem oxidoreductase, putative peroxidase